MAVNVRSSTVRAAAPSHQAGEVVANVASSNAMKPTPGLGSYGMSKAAVGYATRVLAMELADRTVRVCAIGPGGVDTPMLRRNAGRRRWRANTGSRGRSDSALRSNGATGGDRRRDRISRQ
jgi:NAD(P)-dependent dehydrogenase (short-subunit alcohol dehydrogenase family)